MELNLDLLISVIEQYGYLALFFLLWLGIIGLPIPDELVVATGGFVASLGILDPFYAFLFDYLGVVSGLSIGFFLGRLCGKPVLKWLSRKKNMDRYIERSTELIHKYGAFSLCISYLLPVVRHVVPYVVATGGMSYKKYALFSYTTGLVWTACFYMVGFWFGKNMEQIVAVSRMYGFTALTVLVAVALIGFIARRRYQLAKQRYKPEGK